jgi:hypothetical protein
MFVFPYVNMPSIRIPISYVVIPTPKSPYSGGPNLGFSVGSGTSPTPNVSIGIPVMKNAIFPLSWNMSTKFEVVPS